MQLPSEMEALVADAPVRGPAEAVKRLRVARLPVPTAGPGQVLVRVKAAMCSQADLLYLEGRYGIDRPLPATPGFEGTGEVVASGKGLLGRWLLGKRVATGGHACTGTWAQYVVANAQQCMPLDAKLTLEQAAVAVANPITALGLVGLVRAGGHRAYVQNAAGGALAAMVRDVAAERGLSGIQIVRRAEQAAELEGAGVEHVLVSSAPDFASALREKARQLSATIAFDAVTGPLTGLLLDALPPKSEVVVYGALDPSPIGGVDPMGLTFKHQRLRGFEIAGHLEEIGLWRAFRMARAAQARVVAGKAPTKVRAHVPFSEAPRALAEYASAMSEGKVLLIPA